MGIVRIEIALGGIAIAKWVRRKTFRKLNTDKFAVISMSANVYVDNVHVDTPEPRSPLLVSHPSFPYMDEHSSVTLLIRPLALAEGWSELDTGQLIISAVCLLQSEGVPIGECTKAEVRVIEE